MQKKHRIYGKKTKINIDSIKKFFNKRAKLVTKEDILTPTMYQPKKNAEERNESENKLFQESFHLRTNHKILEIGCGAGRWARNLHDQVGQYIGIDYSEGLIKQAREKNNYKNVCFQTMSASEIVADELKVKPPFNIVIIAGVIIYLNDEEVEKMLKSVNSIIKGAVYIKEPVSLTGGRLTLDQFFSEDLQAEYSAIYRTEEEYKKMFRVMRGVSLIKTGRAYNENLQKYKETEHRYFILRSDDCEDGLLL